MPEAQGYKSIHCVQDGRVEEGDHSISEVSSDGADFLVKWERHSIVESTFSSTSTSKMKGFELPGESEVERSEGPEWLTEGQAPDRVHRLPDLITLCDLEDADQLEPPTLSGGAYHLQTSSLYSTTPDILHPIPPSSTPKQPPGSDVVTVLPGEFTNAPLKTSPMLLRSVVKKRGAVASPLLRTPKSTKQLSTAT